MLDRSKRLSGPGVSGPLEHKLAGILLSVTSAFSKLHAIVVESSSFTTHSTLKLCVVPSLGALRLQSVKNLIGWLRETRGRTIAIFSPKSDTHASRFLVNADKNRIRRVSCVSLSSGLTVQP